MEESMKTLLSVCLLIVLTAFPALAGDRTVTLSAGEEAVLDYHANRVGGGVTAQQVFNVLVNRALVQARAEMEANRRDTLFSKWNALTPAQKQAVLDIVGPLDEVVVP
jgi:hypothetical protein